MATIILIEKPAVTTVAQIYHARQKDLAVLAAKKELVAMSTAIDAAAAKGEFSIDYRFSAVRTWLKKDEYKDSVIEIMEADIEAAGYTYTTLRTKGGEFNGYHLSWAEDDEPGNQDEPVDPDPVDPTPVDPDPVDPDPIDEPTYVVADDQDPSHYSVVNPAIGGNENPVEEEWYELVNNQFVETQDTAVDVAKTYYKFEPDSEWEPIDDEPLPEP